MDAAPGEEGLQAKVDELQARLERMEALLAERTTVPPEREETGTAASTGPVTRRSLLRAAGTAAAVGVGGAAISGLGRPDAAAAGTLSGDPVQLNQVNGGDSTALSTEIRSGPNALPVLKVSTNPGSSTAAIQAVGVNTITGLAARSTSGNAIQAVSDSGVAIQVSKGTNSPGLLRLEPSGAGIPLLSGVGVADLIGLLAFNTQGDLYINHKTASGTTQMMRVVILDELGDVPAQQLVFTRKDDQFALTVRNNAGTGGGLGADLSGNTTGTGLDVAGGRIGVHVAGTAGAAVRAEGAAGQPAVQAETAADGANLYLKPTGSATAPTPGSNPPNQVGWVLVTSQGQVNVWRTLDNGQTGWRPLLSAGVTNRVTDRTIVTGDPGSGNEVLRVVSTHDGGLGTILAATTEGSPLLITPSSRSGPPIDTSFLHLVGEIQVDHAARPFICTATGSPGTWRPLLLGGLADQPVATTTNVTAAAGPALSLAGTASGVGLRLVPKAGAGAPAAGVHDQGELAVDANGDLYVCSAGGTPGTWTKLGAAGGAAGPSGGIAFITPTRVLDTRNAGGQGSGGPVVPGQVVGPVARRSHVDLTLAGVAGIPTTAKGILGNLTVVAPTYDGYLSVYPTDGTYRSDTSTLNFVAGGAPVANAVTIGLGTGASAGKLSISTFDDQGSGRCQILLDVVGYFT